MDPIPSDADSTNSEPDDQISLITSQTLTLRPSLPNEPSPPESFIQIERLSLTKKTRELSSDHMNQDTQQLLPKFKTNETPQISAPTTPHQSILSSDLSFLLDSSQEYQTALEKLKSEESKRAYNDLTFPANTDSIVGFSQTNRDIYDQTVVWLKPNLFGFNNSSVKVYESLDPSTIQQGKIGDCYFLAACCSLAQKPQRLERLFLTGRHWQSSGLHAIALNLNGIWEAVLVDDLFPCDLGTGWPIFTTSSDKTIWIMLLEKAWAKVHRGYFQIKTGFSREALRDLTGAPTKSFFFKKKKSIGKCWRELLGAFDDGFAVCASSHTWKKKKEKGWLLKNGLRTAHAYSILDAFEFEHKGNETQNMLNLTDTGETKKMILLRDPWGKTNYKGHWKKSGKAWKAIAENRRLSRQRAHAGAFYMSFQDFLQGFNSIKICYCFDTYKYTALRLENVPKNHLIALQIDIPSKSEYFFSFCQINARCYKHIGDYQYSNISMYLLREYQSGRVDYIKGVFKDFKEGWIRHRCVKGKYWVLVNPHWRSFIKQFVFSVYGPEQCGLRVVGKGL